MIDFACKQFMLKDVIKCSLGLTKADFKLMEYLANNSERSFMTEELAKNLDLNLTTVQRAVKRLHEKNILKRIQKNLELGGYVYIYQIKDKTEIRDLIMSIVNGWSKRVSDELSKL